MRMAVARVLGSAMTRSSTIGAAPAAWNPTIRGSSFARPARWYSLYPRQYAEMLPALPTGIRW